MFLTMATRSFCKVVEVMKDTDNIDLVASLLHTYQYVSMNVQCLTRRNTTFKVQFV